MKKDLQSYKIHDQDFNDEWNSYQNTIATIKKYTEDNVFEKVGFAQAINFTNPLPRTHIDVGSGNGWLIQKTYPLFENVIAVEPSKTGIDLSKKINKTATNITYINKEMIDGLEEIDPKEPVFVTTATVLNHIENYYVAEFLKKVNELPKGSVVFFDERYGRNIDWKMWHVRSKDWWVQNLPNYQITFFNYNIVGYPSGIYGVNRGASEVHPQYTQTYLQKIYWWIDGIINITNRIINKAYRILKRNGN